MTPDSPTRRAKWPIFAAVAAVLLIGVGVAIGLYLNRSTTATVLLPDGSTLKDYAASQAALPACAELYRAGQKIDEAKGKAGCKNPQGVVQLGYFPCKDGRVLFIMEASTGAPEGYGYGGDVFHAVDVATDAGYGQAYQTC